MPRTWTLRIAGLLSQNMSESPYVPTVVINRVHPFRIKSKTCIFNVSKYPIYISQKDKDKNKKTTPKFQESPRCKVPS